MRLDLPRRVRLSQCDVAWWDGEPYALGVEPLLYLLVHHREHGEDLPVLRNQPAGGGM
jgi:hypothetical protein